MFNKQINGVNIIHYNPTPLEQLQSKIEAMKTKRLEKELKPTGPKLRMDKFWVLDQLRDFRDK